MLIIMCGYPKSGKSTFVDILVPHIKCRTHLVRPSDWSPEDGSTPVDNSKWQLACWGYALDKAVKLVSDTTDVVILDTCGASPQSLESLMSVARSHNHVIAAIFVATSCSICEERIDPYIIQKYVSKIRQAVLNYKVICDKLMVVKYDKVGQWNHQATNIANWVNHKINQISQSRESPNPNLGHRRHQ